jgi:hypothetical protein
VSWWVEIRDATNTQLPQLAIAIERHVAAHQPDQAPTEEAATLLAA